jgi:vacuolar-type H+-ATPase subunit I/STV1
MSSIYRILKLNTGEELITRIQKRQNGKVYMETPMCFRTIVMSDPVSGMQKEITILKDWVSYTTDKFVKIPDNIVVSYSRPIEEVVSLYEKEKEKKLKSKRREIKNMDTFQTEIKSNVQKMLDELMDRVQSEDSDMNPPQSLDELLSQMSSMGASSYEFDIEFEIPQEEISDDTTEKDINHPDYGNRWTDWSSDTRKY